VTVALQIFAKMSRCDGVDAEGVKEMGITIIVGGRTAAEPKDGSHGAVSIRLAFGAITGAPIGVTADFDCAPASSAITRRVGARHGLPVRGDCTPLDDHDDDAMTSTELRCISGICRPTSAGRSTDERGVFMDAPVRNSKALNSMNSPAFDGRGQRPIGAHAMRGLFIVTLGRPSWQ
jgi:hypothetical protein